MRILAISDIHGLVAPVTELRTREQNEYDVVVVAGDIAGQGGEGAREIFTILASFDCPIVYVFGNWDSELGADGLFGANCHHVHTKPLLVGSFWFVGLDFPGYGKNRNNELERGKLARLVEKLGPENCVVISHARLSGAVHDMKGVPLFLFGHRHRFQHTHYGGSEFVNAGAIGTTIPVEKSGGLGASLEGIRCAIVSSYAVIDLPASGEISVVRRAFAHDTSGWTQTSIRPLGAPILAAPFVTVG